MSPTRSILSSGYVALDVVRHEGSVRHVAGGTAANVAANLRYLGWRSMLVARLGADAPGRRIRHDLTVAGVEGADLHVDPAVQTPVVIHEVEPPDHSFRFKCPICERKSSKFRPLEVDQVVRFLADQDPSLSFNVVFVDRISSAAVALFEGAPESLRILEPSTKGHERTAVEAAAKAQILKWSRDSRDQLHPSMLAPRPGQLQIESLGSRGLRFRRGDGAWTEVDGFEVAVADSAGAGDWLTSAFLDALPSFQIESLSTREIRSTLVRAQRVAALSCRYIGARTMASVELEEMRAAAATVGERSFSIRTESTGGRRSRAVNVCELCLGCLPA